MYKIKEKIIAAMLVAMIMLANVATVGIYGGVYAVQEDLEKQSMQTNQANVEFDTYFLNGDQKTHEKVANLKQENSIYIRLAVKEAGYLKEAKVTFQNGQEGEANFIAKAPAQENKSIQQVQNDQVIFNQIAKGNEVIVSLPIEMIQEEKISAEKWNAQNKAILTATYIDGEGNEKAVKKEILFNLGWTAEKEINLVQNISKYVPYHINGESGVILQETVQVNLKDNVLPAKQTKIEMKVPTLAGITPKEVIVGANTTSATNGEETAENFSQENYNYDEENQLLTIITENEIDEEGKISWKKNVTDEYLISYVYSEEALNAVAETGTTVQLHAKADIIAYGQTQETVSSQVNTEVELKEQIGEIVSFEVKTNVESLSKAYLYTNTEIPYTETIIANIGLVELTDSIIIMQNTDEFLIGKDSYSTTVGGVGYVYNKTIKVSQKQLEKILGQEGKVEIYAGQSLLATIDHTMQADEQGNYVVDLSNYNLSTVAIKTSKPVVEGKLEFIFDKVIKGDMPYTDAQNYNFVQYKISNLVQSYSGETKVIEQNVEKIITLTEPETTAELTLNNSNLSTVVTNQNIELKAILRTDSIDNKLFRNPSIKITLPSYIEKIEVKDIKLLFDEELQITGANLVNNSDGSKTIVITTKGTQTKYSIGSVSGGANIIITADITVNKLTPNKQANIVMEYTNENVVQQTRSVVEKETKQTEIPVSFVAPTGVVTTNSISNYAEGKEEITSISGEEQIGVIETIAPARNVNYKMSVINNYNNSIENISILGRMPFKGNTNAGGGNEYGSTFDMVLQGAISVEGVESSKVSIYYSTKEKASKELNVASNGWTTTPSNYEEVKSYLIVLNNYRMNTGESISFSYVASIPENLNHNESAYSNYIVYFNNNLEEGTVEDKQEAAKIGVTTGEGPVLEAQMTSNIPESEEILTGRFIKYTATVSNVGENTAENVKLKIPIPTDTTYVELEKENSPIYVEDSSVTEKIFDLGNLKPGEKVTKEIWVKTNNMISSDICTDENHYISVEGEKWHDDDTYPHADEEYKKVIVATAKVEAKDLAKEITSYEVKNTLKNAYFNIFTTTTTNGLELLREGDSFNFIIQVSPYQRLTELNEVNLEIKVPEGLSYQSAKIEYYDKESGQKQETTEGIQYKEEERIISISLNDIKKYQKKIVINYMVDTLEEGIYKKEITNIAKVYAENISSESSIAIVDTIAKEGLEITQSSTIPEGNQIEAGENFVYKFTVTNVGGSLAEIKFEDILPEELQYEYTKYTIDGQTKQLSSSKENVVQLTVAIPEGKKLQIEIGVKAKAITQDTSISNKASIYSKTINKQSNEIKHTILKANIGENGNDNIEKKKISGQVWVDSNKNGIREKEEELVSNVQVMLLNNATGNLVTGDNSLAIIKTTDENGSYIFDNIPKGSYTVIFLYDSANYSATKYKVEEAGEENNSDAVDSKITLDGETKIAAITEAVNVKDSNIYNIDLGLIVSPKFDLRLDKTISKVTVQDSTGTKEYEYNDSKLAKRDLVGKRVNSTTLLIEYKITVTNEGAVEGYVKKIADYIPTGLSFNAELNRDWYQAENGMILNSSLANSKIEAGESKEVRLLLTMKTNENNLGLISNQAEIYEAYNDLGIEDIDSTEGNKASNEDDMSTADLVVTVKTGEYILFAGLTILVVGMIGLGAYFIKKKVLR